MVCVRGRLAWLLAGVAVLLALAGAFTLGFALGARQEARDVAAAIADAKDKQGIFAILISKDPYSGSYWTGGVLLGLGAMGSGWLLIHRRRRQRHIP